MQTLVLGQIRRAMRLLGDPLAVSSRIAVPAALARCGVGVARTASLSAAAQSGTSVLKSCQPCAPARGEPRVPTERVDFGWSPMAPQPGQTVTFTAVGRGLPRGGMFSWDLDRDHVYDAAGRTATARLRTTGSHPALLRAVGRNGRSVTDAGGRPLVVQHLVPAIVVAPACASAQPFNLLLGASDSNGLPLNPEWAWQRNYHGSGTPL